MDGRRLRYLQAMGIQLWVPRAAPAPPAPAAPPETPGPVETPPPPAPEATAGGEAAWERLRAEVLGCTRCGLCERRTQAVFGVGDRQASWLVVGEGPGADEDRLGEPFVGRAGRLLDEMLRAIGLERGEGVYIANVVKCRPPQNRDPRPEEVAACLPYLHRQIALLRPRLILAVGRIAAQHLLHTDRPLAALRRRIWRLEAPADLPAGEGPPSGVAVVVTYHPAYLLRSPQDKRKAWEDLLFARWVLREREGGEGP